MLVTSCKAQFAGVLHGFVQNGSYLFMGFRSPVKPRTPSRFGLSVSSFWVLLVILGICGMVGVGMLFVKNTRVQLIQALSIFGFLRE